MKTRCFLDRPELTDIFGPLSQMMPEDVHCLYLTYDTPEAATLAAKGIADVAIFKELLPAFLKCTPPDAARLAEMERLIVAAKDVIFGLNSAIRSDRTIQGMAYDDCLRLADAYLAFWQGYVAKHQVDHILHETVSFLFKFMAAVALARRGGSYLYCIMSRAEPGDFRFIVMQGVELVSPDIARALALPPSTRGADEYTREGLQAFRKSSSTFFGGAMTQSVAWHRLAANA